MAWSPRTHRRCERHNAAISRTKPAPPMGALGLPDICHGRAAELRRAWHSPPRHCQLTDTIGRVANYGSRVVGEDAWERRKVACRVTHCPRAGDDCRLRFCNLVQWFPPSVDFVRTANPPRLSPEIKRIKEFPCAYIISSPSLRRCSWVWRATVLLVADESRSRSWSAGRYERPPNAQRYDMQALPVQTMRDMSLVFDGN